MLEIIPTNIEIQINDGIVESFSLKLILLLSFVNIIIDTEKDICKNDKKKGMTWPIPITTWDPSGLIKDDNKQ